MKRFFKISIIAATLALSGIALADGDRSYHCTDGADAMGDLWGQAAAGIARQPEAEDKLLNTAYIGSANMIYAACVCADHDISTCLERANAFRNAVAAGHEE